MIRKRSARALAGGLATVLLLVAASAAYAAVSGHFSGKTNQKQSISFNVGRGHLTNMRFAILLKCPSGHIYLGHDRVFVPITINKAHKFDDRLTSSSDPTQDELHVFGTVFRKQVKGRLVEHRHINKERATCVGRASFTAHKQ